MKDRSAAFLKWGDVNGRRYEPLSERERQILQHLAFGMNAREIALELVRSEHTIKNHIRSSLHKLRASSQVQAVATAMRLGLIQ